MSLPTGYLGAVMFIGVPGTHTAHKPYVFLRETAFLTCMIIISFLFIPF